METIERLAGVKLDADRLDYELARRGLRQYELAELAGITQATLSRARHGVAISPETLRRLVAALLKQPPVPGADLLLKEPGQKRTAAADPVRT